MHQFKTTYCKRETGLHCWLCEPNDTHSHINTPSHISTPTTPTSTCTHVQHHHLRFLTISITSKLMLGASIRAAIRTGTCMRMHRHTCACAHNTTFHAHCHCQCATNRPHADQHLLTTPTPKAVPRMMTWGPSLNLASRIPSSRSL